MKGFIKITFDNTPNKTVSVEYAAEQAGKNAWFNAVPLVQDQLGLDFKNGDIVDFVFTAKQDDAEKDDLLPQEVHARLTSICFKDIQS